MDNTCLDIWFSCFVLCCVLLCLPATVSELCVIFIFFWVNFVSLKQKAKKIKAIKTFMATLRLLVFLALSNAEPHADDTQKEFIYFMNPSTKVISLFSLKTKNNVVDMVTLFLILLFNFFFLLISFFLPFFLLLLLLFLLYFSKGIKATTSKKQIF